jgi:hypothetical protein
MLWEMAAGLNNEYRLLVAAGNQNIWAKYFRTEGKEMQWPDQPKVEPFLAKRKKKQKPRGDIEYVTWGAIVLNERAYQILRDTLLPFGQFLQLDCLGELGYFYNVTTLCSVVDYEKSAKTEGMVTKPIFQENAISSGVRIFKDPLTAPVAIYLTDEAKELLASLIAQNNLKGLYLVPAGSI